MWDLREGFGRDGVGIRWCDVMAWLRKEEKKGEEREGKNAG